MPFYAGFHPYFYAPGSKAVSLGIPSEDYTDIKTGRKEKYHGILKLNQRPETNLVFAGLTGNQAWFDREDGYRISIGFDDNFRYIVLWVLQDKDFLCLEPWMGTNFDMNRGRHKVLSPGEKLNAVVKYSMNRIENKA